MLLAFYFFVFYNEQKSYSSKIIFMSDLLSDDAGESKTAKPKRKKISMGKKVENEEQGNANGFELAGNFGGDDTPSAPQNTAQNANEVVITSTPI